jgi:hypothetical protein
MIEIHDHDLDEKYSFNYHGSHKLINSCKTLGNLDVNTFLFSIKNKYNEYGNYLVNLTGLEKSTIIKYLIFGNVILYLSIFSLLIKYN